MARNIILCLDGTGNQIKENLSNVLKLYRVLYKRDTQLVYYDQGVGTLGEQHTWGVLSQKAKAVWGLLTGHGLDTNVLQAYRFLIEHYQAGDKIFIFGFSRGAHTARVLAGLIYEVGILRREQVNLAGAALTVYKRAASDKNLPQLYHFKRIIKPHLGSVHFLGVWDTVSSVIVPRADRFFMPSLEKLRSTSANPAVRIFRHAMALDERRRMFCVDQWDKGQEYKPNFHSQGDVTAQDAQEVWFAGVHSDVGGGYKRGESAIAQFPLIWMAEAAIKAGAKINNRMLSHVAKGKPYNAQSQHNYPAPDPLGKVHNSMNAGWLILEYLPKKSGEDRKNKFGFYLPLSEPREVEEGANIHKSAIDRRNAGIEYDPPNLPTDYTVVK